MSETIRIRGIAERAGSPEQPLGPDVVIPEHVIVRREFNHSVSPLGMATLRRDENGDIWADAEVTISKEDREALPYFAVGIVRAVVVSKSREHRMGVITAGEITELTLTRKNVDPDLPPYEVVGA